MRARPLWRDASGLLAIRADDPAADHRASSAAGFRRRRLRTIRGYDGTPRSSAISHGWAPTLPSRGMAADGYVHRALGFAWFRALGSTGTYDGPIRRSNRLPRTRGFPCIRDRVHAYTVRVGQRLRA